MQHNGENDDNIISDAGSRKCKTVLRDYTTCTRAKAAQPCPADITGDHASLWTNDCVVDCCPDNHCVGLVFGGVYTNVETNTSPATPAPTSTTTAATTTRAPYSVYAQLEKECRDHLEPGACDSLKATQDLCQQNGTGLHIDLCPETCGVCQAIKEANCHDTVLDGECAQLIAEKDICHESIAVYTCAASCGLCDILVEQKLALILAGKLSSTASASTAPTTPASTAGTTTTTATTTIKPTTKTTTTTPPTTTTTPGTTAPTQSASSMVP
ncbi:hypothetical protein PoB_000037200 [Plakobranchus ocellatus]|uniref:ShKT domain-containing protein n=1 Tax=Plakobranchus ocellatus TaxID=259542 RepID=A0AAV3XVI5_9GAST|nr:hypothetical protein PoB_000037200 [Plakobranchus ocellatus]